MQVRVLEGREEDFVAATLKNQAASLEEPGIFRFELLRDEADARRFVLVEGYADDAAQAAHKETGHYAAWRQAVEPLMAEPRTRTVYSILGPGEAGPEVRDGTY